MDPQTTKVSPPPPVPGFGKFMYMFGNVGIAVTDRIMATWVMFFYLPPAGTPGLVQLIPTQLFGIIFFVGRFLDTFFDPGVAYYSDRCRSKIGRRTPFMLYGGLPLAAFMALMFFPPTHGISAFNSIYLCVVLSTFFFFFSFYVCPYLGLLPELFHSEKERMDMTSGQGVFLLLGTVIAMVCSPMLIKPFGYRGMALIMGGIALFSLSSPVIGIREKKYCVAAPSSLNLTQTILETLKNKPFVIYLFGNLTFWFGFNIISTCVPYYVTALLKQPKENVTIFFGLALGLALVFIPIVNFLTKKTSKRNIMIMSLSMFMVLLPTIYFFGDSRIPVPPVMFGYIIIALLGLPLATLFIVPNAIVADLTDYDAKITGQRREAIYFGTQGLFLKIDLGLSQLLMTTFFARFGYSLANPLGIRYTGIVGGIFALTGLVAFLFFPKDLNAHAELEKKRRAGLI